MNDLVIQIEKLEKLEHVNKKTISAFIERINEGQPYTKPQNKTSHFCVLFIPFHKASNQVYIGNHIKAGIWCPPGGHIDIDEGPVDTIRREFREELNYTLKNEVIEIYNANKTVCIPTGICRLHFDFFYIVYMDRLIDFVFEKREFFDAGWFSLDEAIIKIKYRPFNDIMKKLNIVRSDVT